MNDEEKSYKVYLHVFPDGKKYVGCTCNNVRQRWDKGFGYKNQKVMFSAICQCGWNNVKHYILFDGLDGETALLTEAALIEKWKTYRPSCGYNTRRPQIPGKDDFILPKFKKERVYDEAEHTETGRIKRRIKRRKDGDSGNGSKRVIVVGVPFDNSWSLKPGQEFDSIAAAAEALLVAPSSIRRAITHNGRERTCRGYVLTLCEEIEK